MPIRRDIIHVTKNGNNLTLNLPAHVLAAKNIRRGDHYMVQVVGDSILYTPIERQLDRIALNVSSAAAEHLARQRP